MTGVATDTINDHVIAGTRYGALVVQAPLNTLQSQRPEATLLMSMRVRFSH